ncbi:hypothetical protein T484DRAFT_1974730 [Baffinella frigidus]|nr:hypothetical protein T484DRAFT_1974730 [Cryptophyta sp. CCMP2293]
MRLPYTLHALHYTLYTKRFTLNALHSTLYTKRFTPLSSLPKSVLLNDSRTNRRTPAFFARASSITES